MINLRSSILVSILLLFFLPNICLAEETVDGILVLDTSGSMRQNDPEEFRIDGQQTFLDILTSDEDNRFGIVHFDTRARLIQPLTLINKSNINLFKQKLERSTSRGQWTEIGRGLDEAYDEFLKQGGVVSKQYVILMTDGEVDRSPDPGDDERARKELMQTVLKFKEKGIAIFTMALTEYSRRALEEEPWEMRTEPAWTQGEKLLQKIAEDTGGDFKRILSKEDIEKFIKLVYIRVRPPAAVITTGERGEFFSCEYDKAIVCIVPPFSVLVSPSGERYVLNSDPNILSLEFQVYPYRLWEVILIYRPEDKKLWDTNKWQGEWLVQKPDGAPIPNQEIWIKSNLKLVWYQEMRKEYSQNEVVDINVKIEYKDEGSEEILEEVLSDVKCSYYIWKPDSKEPIVKELRGQFSERGDYFYKGEFDQTDVQGTYALKVEMVNESIKLKRSLSEKFKISEPYILFKGINKDKGEVIFDSSKDDKVKISRCGEVVELIAEMTDKFPKLATPLDLKGEILSPTEKKQILTFKRNEEKKTYSSETFSWGKKGTYHLKIDARGKKSVTLERFDPWSHTEEERITEIPFVIRYRQEIPVAGTLFYTILRWTIWSILVLLFLIALYSIYLRLLPGLNVNLEILEPEPGVLAINLSNKPWWNRLWNKIFPKRENTIGSSAKADYHLPDKPVEKDSGLSARIRVDRKGNIYLHSLTKPSYIKIGNRLIDQKGMIIRKPIEVLEDFKIQIGKYTIRFS